MTATRGIGNLLARGFDQTANSLAMTDLRAKPEIARGRLDIEGAALGFRLAGIDLDACLADIERQLLVAALEKSGGVRKEAARLLHTTFRSLRYRLAKYGLGGEDDVDLQSEREP